jgi:hypothetical protein
LTGFWRRWSEVIVYSCHDLESGHEIVYSHPHCVSPLLRGRLRGGHQKFIVNRIPAFLPAAGRRRNDK